MTTLLDRASSHQVAQIRAQGETVTYIEGAVTITDLKALLGRNRNTSAGHDGIQKTIWSDQDFLVVVADLVAGGASAEPKRGVRIQHTTGGETFTYEILPFGDESHWRFSGPGKAVIRLHGKLLSRA